MRPWVRTYIFSQVFKCMFYGSKLSFNLFDPLIWQKKSNFYMLPLISKNSIPRPCSPGKIHNIFCAIANCFEFSTFFRIRFVCLKSSGTDDIFLWNSNFYVIDAMVRIEFRISMKLVTVPSSFFCITHTYWFINTEFWKPLCNEIEIISVAGSPYLRWELCIKAYIYKNS